MSASCSEMPPDDVEPLREVPGVSGSGWVGSLLINKLLVDGDKFLGSMRAGHFTPAGA